MANIIRDTDAMERFTQAIINYDENIEAACRKMEYAISAAEDGLQDSATRKAASNLYELIADTRNVTALDETGAVISKGAKVLKRTSDIWRR